MRINLNLNLKFATSWNALTPKQLQEISYGIELYLTFLECRPKETHPLHFSRLFIHIVKNLLRVNNWFKVWISLRQVPPEEYKKEIQFLLDGVTRTKFLPAFKLKNTIYYPPLDRLQNITIKEFSFIDTMYYNWRKTKKDIYLDHLCAALYRPAGGDELDIRKPFNKILVEKEVDKFGKLNKKKKVAIGYTYEGCRNYIAQLYPHVFPKPIKNEAEEEENTPKKEPAYTPFGQLLMYKIKFDTSKLESTQNLNAHEFLGIYENELKEQKNHK